MILIQPEGNLLHGSECSVAEEPEVKWKVPVFGAHSSKFISDMCYENLDSFYTASSKCSDHNKEKTPNRMKTVFSKSTASLISLRVHKVKNMLMSLVKSELGI